MSTVELLPIPPQCTALIEGFEKCRLEAYMDMAGNPTIGWGHKILDGENYSFITQEQADALLVQDIQSTARLVKRLTEKVQLNDNQYSALISFAYNVGPTAFSSSTLLKRLNARDYVGAAMQFPVWNKVTINGQRKVSAGLVARRAAEKALFLTAVDTKIPEPPNAASGVQPQSV